VTVSPVEIAAQAAATSPSLVQEPIVQGLTWVAGLVAILFGIGKPIRDYIKREKRDTAEGAALDARSNAETVLYTHLSNQITEYRNLAEIATSERNELIKRVAALESTIRDTSNLEELLDHLKKKLDEKDLKIETCLSEWSVERKKFLDILSAKEEELSRRDQRIYALETRQRELELRLTRDEKNLVPNNCPLRSQDFKVSPT